ncbi:quinone oxidoreductase [Kaistia dalseonensis]|uniref:NADPH2:quinone reductase n=1 Tax=Kaistia dalseonensis TaxID=410840 RepID=A0ABU0H3R9_9HYPH|nr:quinone oxidoreductase [Kaistia dalseonensis]MCX5493967.1 quinone oxidoreductase [Kaistia dalseonensis]MDQ0436543.1 NADPH2:quinone reductase [Kaistia dalseonensis]
MVQAIRIHANGGPEALSWDTITVGEPGPGEVRVRHKAIGLNFIDVYFRSGLYPPPAPFPFIPGSEGVGIVEAVADGVSELKVGDRVGYAGSIGSYCEARLIPADRLVPIPDTIGDSTAAAVLLKGMTARYLLRETFKVGPSTTVLFHAAAGGVGLIASQWAASLGGTVIGTVGSQEKADLALANGCAHVINYRTEDFVARVSEITGGRKVDVVYDSVGKDTFPGSLDCLRPRGLWVSFGQSSGSVPPFDIGILNRKGSLFATRPSLFGYVAERTDLLKTAADLFATIASGAISVPEPQTFALSDVAAAQTALEERRTTGSVVLLP